MGSYRYRIELLALDELLVLDRLLVLDTAILVITVRTGCLVDELVALGKAGRRYHIALVAQGFFLGCYYFFGEWLCLADGNNWCSLDCFYISIALFGKGAIVIGNFFLWLIQAENVLNAFGNIFKDIFFGIGV